MCADSNAENAENAAQNLRPQALTAARGATLEGHWGATDRGGVAAAEAFDCANMSVRHAGS